MKNTRLFWIAVLVVFSGLFAGCSRKSETGTQTVSQVAQPTLQSGGTEPFYIESSKIPLACIKLDTYRDGSLSVQFSGTTGAFICAVSVYDVDVRLDTTLDGTYVVLLKDKTITDPHDGRYNHVKAVVILVRTEKQSAQWKKFIDVLWHKDVAAMQKKMRESAPRDVSPPPIPDK